MLTGIWPCSLPSGKLAQEYFIAFDKGRGTKILMVPPLFDEHNKMRRQMIAVMRNLDAAGIDSVLPDCPGWNESLQPMEEQSLTGWNEALQAASGFTEATHVMAWRSGALISPRHLPGWLYAPLSGAKILRSMMRARTISAREAGVEENLADLEQAGRQHGVALAGWHLGPELFCEIETAEPPATEMQREIPQRAIGGTGLWLRAEPDYDPLQAEALAAKVLEDLK